MLGPGEREITETSSSSLDGSGKRAQPEVMGGVGGSCLGLGLVVGWVRSFGFGLFPLQSSKGSAHSLI